MLLSLRALLIALSVLLLIPACGSESDGDSGADTGGSTDTGGVSTADIAALTGDVTAGETVYANSCAFCHTATGGENGTTPALTDRVPGLSKDAVIENVLNGKGSMPGFASTLENQQIADVVAYVQATFGG